VFISVSFRDEVGRIFRKDFPGHLPYRGRAWGSVAHRPAKQARPGFRRFSLEYYRRTNPINTALALTYTVPAFILCDDYPKSKMEE